MTPRTRWIAALVIAAAVVAIGWSKWHAMPPAAARASAVPSTTRDATSPAVPPANDEANAKPPAPRAKPPTTPSHVLPDWRTPFGEAVATLREYAEAGDNDAAIELSWRLSRCTEHELKIAERSEQSDRHDIEQEKTNELFTPDQRAVRIKNMQRRIDEYVSQREACRALSADLRADWLGWIDRAAQSGNTAAMRGYARVANQYYNVEDVRNDLDTAIERRDKSRAYLEEALRRGDAEALRDLADAYRDSAHPTIYPLDPAKAYAYAYAGTLAGISRGNDLDRTMEETTRLLDAQQLSEAEAAGRRIYEKCCHPR